jgi:hypothetical protein
MSTVAQQVRELKEMTVAQLVARYEELFGKPPRVLNAAFLRRHVAWKIQEREFGGLSNRARARLDELIGQIDLPLGEPGPPRPRRARRNDPKTPLVGTTLVREWRGQQLRVEVRETGFEWDGIIYKSMSAVAKAITGANWNGKLFFNLVKRRAGA